MFVKKFASAIAIFGLVLFMMLAINAGNVRAQSYPLDSLYVTPSAVNFNSNNASLGQEFNVTVWAYMENNTFTWQLTMNFNASLVQVVKTGYTGSPGSQFFAGHTTTPVTAIVDNSKGSVQCGETLLDDDYGNQTNASLTWIDFKVVEVPTGDTPSLTDVFDINNTGTFFTDGNLNLITTAMYDAPYSFAYAVAPVPPSITDVTQAPLNGSIGDSQPVTVSANVTDSLGVANVTLSYSTDNATFTNTTMTLNATTGLYEGIIPGTINTIGTTVYYQIIAYDNAGNYAINANTGNWSYLVPEFTSVLIILMLLSMASAVLLMRKKLIR